MKQTNIPPLMLITRALIAQSCNNYARCSDVTEHDSLRSLADPYFPVFILRAGAASRLISPMIRSSSSLNVAGSNGAELCRVFEVGLFVLLPPVFLLVVVMAVVALPLLFRL